jgi:predicted dehydrogenase
MVGRSPLRIGVLGAARIAPMALVRPARSDPDALVTAVAARSPERAHHFAARHGIPVVHQTYDDLLADPDVDAVYVPLPNGLHGRWTLAAIRAGKPVLCEKPFAANAQEAETVAAAARAAGLVVMEAFHYRYHALLHRVREIIASELGEVSRIESWFHIPLLPGTNIRWDLSLAGGALMDVGCYPVHLVRTLAGSEPEVVGADASVRRPGVDRSMHAELAFADGVTASVSASLLTVRRLAPGVRVSGSRGTLAVDSPFHPHVYNRLAVRGDGGRRRVERVPKHPTTFAAQLRAFVRAVRTGEPVPTSAEEAIANMRVIDAIYRAAGLPLRQPVP